MNPESKRRVIPKVENGIVVLTIPAGDEEYPEGKVYRFRSFTPTDAIELSSGELFFPNNDGITAAALLSMTPDEIAAMAGRFEEAVQVIDENERIKKELQDLVKQMAPRYSGQIRLEFAANGKNKIQGDILIPTSETIRIPGFARLGIEYRNRYGEVAHFQMVVNDEGKFDYTSEGILYSRTD